MLRVALQGRFVYTCLHAQEKMVLNLEKRYFSYDFWRNPDSKPFASASTWVHFTRLIPFVAQILSECAQECSAVDLVVVKEREFWKGEYDGDIASLSLTLPTSLQDNPQLMVGRIKEQLHPIRALLVALSGLPKGVVVVSEQAAEESTTAGDGQAETVAEGNVSNYLPHFATMSKEAKLDLATTMTQQAAVEKERKVKALCMQQAGRAGSGLRLHVSIFPRLSSSNVARVGNRTHLESLFAHMCSRPSRETHGRHGGTQPVGCHGVRASSLDRASCSCLLRLVRCRTGGVLV